MCVLRTPVYMCMRGAFRTVDLGSHDLYCNPVIVPFQTLDPEHCGILDLQFIGISLYCCFAGLAIYYKSVDRIGSLKSCKILSTEDPCSNNSICSQRMCC